jgi:hypothetical protein
MVRQVLYRSAKPQRAGLSKSRMDAIYKGPKITIVAAAGDGANSGLAGVRGTPRIPQQSLSIGNIQLISSMHVLREKIESSTWFGRSWTLQEGTLSLRRLVFTPQGAYFECESMHCCQSWEADLCELHSYGRFRKLSSAGLFTGSLSKTKKLQEPASRIEKIRPSCERILDQEVLARLRRDRFPPSLPGNHKSIREE